MNRIYEWFLGMFFPRKLAKRRVMQKIKYLKAMQQRASVVPQPRKANSRPGRNELCPCGSGKKYKFCCGK